MRLISAIRLPRTAFDVCLVLRFLCFCVQTYDQLRLYEVCGHWRTQGHDIEGAQYSSIAVQATYSVTGAQRRPLTSKTSARLLHSPEGDQPVMGASVRSIAKAPPAQTYQVLCGFLATSLLQCLTDQSSPTFLPPTSRVSARALAVGW